MLLETDGDGKYLSDSIVANSFVGFLLASQATNSSALTSVVNFLAQLPHIYNDVFKGEIIILD